VPYLSEIKRAKVVDPQGVEIGRLADVAVVPREQFPAVQWAIVRAADGERIVRWADLEATAGHYRLRDSAIKSRPR
jgi:sporulation protein YlmC with PRC-barrel domain